MNTFYFLSMEIIFKYCIRIYSFHSMCKCIMGVLVIVRQKEENKLPHDKKNLYTFIMKNPDLHLFI